MSNTRLIARLDIKGPNLIKGIRFEGLRVMGSPAEHALRCADGPGVDLLAADAEGVAQPVVDVDDRGVAAQFAQQAVAIQPDGRRLQPHEQRTGLVGERNAERHQRREDHERRERRQDACGQAVAPSQALRQPAL